MADEEQLRILKQGVEVWNEWRGRAGDLHVDLSGADVSGADLRAAELLGANLSGAVLSGAYISHASLRGANLSEADLRWANLSWANLTGANLREANLNEARFFETVVSNVDLRGCKNLESIRHYGPSTVDIRTLQRSGHLPLAFLRGVGLPEVLIEYLPSLLGQAIQHYSCFISYASKDEDFVRRLHADLQDNGVRCWFAPEDMTMRRSGFVTSCCW